jgi:hypothetical protein
MATVTSSGRADRAPSLRTRRVARHDNAVIQAEVRRLARTIAPFGVLHHDSLRELANAAHWNEGGFEASLSAAVREGVIDPLPGNFYRDATHLHSAG